jgi:hypothetical protein
VRRGLAALSAGALVLSLACSSPTGIRRVDGPAEGGADGVVQYRSAYLKQVDSTLVVRSPHSCQGNFATIEEIRRILREHAGIR